MLTGHVSKNLSAYCHGELASVESRAVAEHLLQCEACRRAYDEIKLGVQLAERLPLHEAPEALWSEIETALARGETQAPRRTPQTWHLAVAASLVVAAGLGVAWYLRPARGVWDVAALNGSPTVGSSRIDERGRIGIGQALETDERSRARIDVGAIGYVEVEPNSRVRLVDARLTDHRLALDRGTMHARIWAPPRLFFVETPAALAVDYGCAYTMTVAESGDGLLEVTLGKVALVLDGRESFVPAGAQCRMRLGTGPGTPYFADAANSFQDALARFDFEGGGEPSLETVLTQARPRDSLTLWFLLSKTVGPDRGRVFDRLAAFVPPPEGVSRESALALDRSALDRWWEALGVSWQP